MPVDDYISALYETLVSISRTKQKKRPNVVVLTPGIYNSAYFEHAFLARGMGSELVEGEDLFVKGGEVFMRSVAGPVKVDVIYRRVDEDYLDPEVFNKDSMLGVPGLMRVWKEGKVAIANAWVGSSGRQSNICLRARHHRVLLKGKTIDKKRQNLSVLEAGGA